MFNICRLLWFETLITIAFTARPPRISSCDFEENILNCTGNIPNLANRLYSKNVTVLHLSHLYSNVLDLKRITASFPYLRSLSILDGNVSFVVFPEENNIKFLQLKKLSLVNISSSFLESFQRVEILHLERNHLKSFPEGFSFPELRELYLKDNQWNCSEDLDWVLKLSKAIAKDVDNLTCYGNPHSGKRLIAVAQYLKDVREQCRIGCTCTLEKITVTNISLSHSSDMPIIAMNCSNLGLTELPSHLPNYTRILHLEGNLIASVEPLKSNKIYKGIWDLYLDNNRITGIGVLEGSYWLTHFRTFSLRGNKLTKLPSFALDNAFLKNPNMPITRIYLGANPWRCDCLFTPVFQELVLRKYADQVMDSFDVKCYHVEGDERMRHVPIIELTRSSLCRLPTEYSLQEGLDLLNAVLVSLIIFILAKLAYDYYHFKRTGRLPWIIMKMP